LPRSAFNILCGDQTSKFTNCCVLGQGV